MKKFTFRLMMIGVTIVCLLGSCKKTNSPIEGMCFSATIEGDGNKTYLDGLVGDQRKVFWSEYDQIKVANNIGTGTTSQTLTYELTQGARSANGIFYTSSDHTDFFHGDYAAAYPAANVTSIRGKEVTFRLPATQSMGTNSFGNGCNPMVAYSDTQTLSFKNVCGVLCFPLSGTHHVSSVVLTSSGQPLCGTFTVDADNPDSFTYKSDGGNSITLTCNVTLSSTPTNFYFVLPPITLSVGYTLEVYDGDVQLYNWSSAHAAEVQRSRIKKSNTIPVPMGVIPGEFAVSASKKVYFTQGNLQYQASPSTWRFAEHQWDYVGNDNAHISSSYSGWIDLFGWGTSGWNSGATCYQPYSTSTSGYNPGGIATNDLTGACAQADWGVYNSIKVGESTIAAGTYRTLTIDEWTYVMSNHTKNRSIVNGVLGLVLRPYGVSDVINSSYTAEAWASEEAAGAVFLPFAGYRTGTTYHALDWGYYWSSTHWGENSNGACALYINNDGSPVTDSWGGRGDGVPVRLVCPVQ